MLLRFLNFIHAVRTVYLLDYSCELRTSVESTSKFGMRRAFVYWGTGTGEVFLRQDGTCSGPASFIKYWAYTHPRNEHEQHNLDELRRRVGEEFTK